MKAQQLNEALYNKYIAPTTKPRSTAIGIEIEMPVVNITGEAVDENIVIAAADAFREHFPFEIAGRDDNGCVNSMTEKQSGDNLSFDCSYSNLEISMGKGDDLNELHARFKKYYNYLQQLLRPHGYTLTGMGINPNCDSNHNQPVPNERYRMLYHYLHSYPKYATDLSRHFHNRPDFGTFTSASQVQLDVQKDDLIQTINVFSKLEPIKALLFSNSVFLDENKHEKPSDDEIKFALWGGTEGITDEMYEEVKQFAEMVRLREQAKLSKDGK